MLTVTPFHWCTAITQGWEKHVGLLINGMYTWTFLEHTALKNKTSIYYVSAHMVVRGQVAAVSALL